jgi:hypothetical protein
MPAASRPASDFKSARRRMLTENLDFEKYPELAGRANN